LAGIRVIGSDTEETVAEKSRTATNHKSFTQADTITGFSLADTKAAAGTTIVSH